MADAGRARALLRRALRAARLIPVAYVRRKTAANFVDAFRLYADSRYDHTRNILLHDTTADVVALERLVHLSPSDLALFFRKNALQCGEHAAGLKR
jgi:hypothetical protein